MADIFISYAPKDRETAKALAQALADRGLSVWWTSPLVGGGVQNVIERELNEARCMIVLWSTAALDSRWLPAEVGYALDQDKLVLGVKIEEVLPPLAFRMIHPADLIGWEGDQSDPRFQQLLARISDAFLPLATSAPKFSAPRLFRRWSERFRHLLLEPTFEKGPDHPTRRETIRHPPEDNIRFTVYLPVEIKPEVWFTLLAYVHIMKMQTEVEKDAKQRLQVPHSRRSTKGIRAIARGAEISIVPELPGCWFNPPFARLLWLEDWHRVEFRLQARQDRAGFELGKAINGRVAFYVESVLVGEVPIWTCISNEADTAAADAPATTSSAEPYEAIFVSYAHEDNAVVDRLGRAYKVLGMKFLRDIEALRSGEKWNPALLAMIDQADIFQLYWSRAAQCSRYVEHEWRYALKQQKNHFIRPLYWQIPMPQPPCELAQLHFSYFELDN